MLTATWSIRWKLTAWYILALLVVVCIFATLMLVMMGRYLHQRTDAELVEEARELTEEIAAHNSMESFLSRFNRHYEEHGGFSFQVSLLDGTVICGSPWLRAHPLSQVAANRLDGSIVLQDVGFSQLGLHRVLSKVVPGPTGSMLIQVVVPCAQTRRQLWEFIQILLWSGMAALCAACLGGLAIARRALRPLERITNAAEKISAENLSISIDVENPRDELGRLASTLNGTFRRLRDSMDRMQQFTADAAHELRTPLTVMRTKLEVAVRGNADAEELRGSYQIALEQAEKLTRLIDQLLTLTREDAGVETTVFEDVCVNLLLEDVVDSLRPTAANKRVCLTIEPLPECSVHGDDISLSRLFFNLIDNAIKYTPPGGKVRLSGSCNTERMQLTITDTGVGIARDQLPYVFDRFYRANRGRSDHTGGTGLGLAICRSIVEAHRGEISVSSIEGQGTTLTVVLPVITQAEELSGTVAVQHD